MEKVQHYKKHVSPDRLSPGNKPSDSKVDAMIDISTTGNKI